MSKNHRKNKPYYRYDCLAYYRALRTTQEKRWAVKYNSDEDFLEYRVKTRAKRGKRGLPNSWDDYSISAWDTWRSWKHNSKRLKQWVTKDEKGLKPKPIWNPQSRWADKNVQDVS